ncbi:MAG: NACHT domain-containing NTPase, partial [Prochloraceae cyanobacterium]
LKDLAKDATKDWVKDFFKDCLKDRFEKVVELMSKEPLDISAGKALKEFLQLVQQELKNADLDEQELQQYIEPLKQFIKNKSVKETLGSAFQEDCKVIDTEILAKTWKNLQLLSLPNEFDWELVGKLYKREVKKIIRNSEELRKILDSQTLEEIGEGVKQIAGIAPDFYLIKYREGIQEQYANLKLESLDTSGYAYNELKLWRMFIEQNVRESQEFLPQVYEIPKEYQRKLRESGQLEAELSREKLKRYRKYYYQQPIRPVLEVIKDEEYKYLVILGDPGSGKSTLLQYIALEWAELPIKELRLHPIPLLIELRRYMRSQEPPQQCKTFLEFIHRSSSWVGHLNQNDLHEYLKAGKAVVMFDALDEVFDLGKREDVISQIHNFTQDYPNVQVIVTSRVIGYKPQQLRDAEFYHFMLQDLESEQIDDFIQRWHDLTYKNEEEKVRTYLSLIFEKSRE